MKIGRLQAGFVSIALFLLAMVIRAYSFRWVFGADGISLRGNDSFYHLRRVAYAVSNFPSTLEFDRYINFPAGARPIWTPVLDWLLALIAWPFAGEIAAGNQISTDGIESVVIWVPPILGGLTVVSVYLTARGRIGEVAAIVAAMILCLLPAHSFYSQVGFVDHHVAVALASWLALVAAMRWLERDSVADGRPVWFAAPVAGAAFAGAVLVWPGSVLHVILLEVGLLIYLLSRRELAWAVRAASQFALANAVALILVLPFCLNSDWEQWGAFQPVVLTDFQPWFFGVLSGFGLMCAGVWHLVGPGVGWRWATGCLFGAGILFSSFSIFPGLGEGVVEAYGWLARTESFQSQVRESLPLLVKDGQISFEWAVRYLSGFVLLFPLALGAAWAVVSRREQQGPLLLFLWFSAGLFAAALAQRRFVNSFSLPMAVLMGWGCWSIYRGVAARMSGRSGARVFALVVAGAFALLLLLPAASFYGRAVRYEFARQEGRAGAIPVQVTHERRMNEVALFLRDHTPPTSGWLDASIEPEYSVLGPWSIGHRIEYLARRPSVTNAFGDDIGRENFRLANRYFILDEFVGMQLLTKMRARYVVVGREPPPQRGTLSGNSMYRALYLRDGVQHPRGYPALEQHRLVFESGPTPRTGPDGPAAFKVFEPVFGAVISGWSAPGVTLQLALQLRTNRGREIVYSTTAVASEGGDFTFRVPYATSGYPGLVRPQRAYSLKCNDESVDVTVEEVEVQEGHTVRVADLCLD